MKTLILILAFISFAAVKANAQWNLANSGTYAGLMDVKFTDDSTAFVTGLYGVLKTVDRGQTWSTAFADSNAWFGTIFFPTHDTGYIGGRKNFINTILKTTDGGQTWSYVDTTSLVVGGGSISSLFFTSTDTGYAGFINGGLGESIYKTTNGGYTWNNITPSFMSNAYDIHFPNSNLGYAVFANLFKTPDAGNNWTISPPLSNDFLSVQFLNDTNGYACGIYYGNMVNYGAIIKSTNGGNTWSIDTFPSTFMLTSIYFPSAEIGYCVGGRGVILKSEDEGLNWITQMLDSNLHFSSIHCFNDSVCIAVGGDYFASPSGIIYRTISGGVGIKDVYPESNSIQIYPNPATPTLTIEFFSSSEKKELNIYNTLGEKILTENFSGQKHSVNVSTFANGIYFAEVRTEKAIITKKFIKF